MKEHKFKAWDKRQKKWLYEFEFAISGEGDVYLYTQGISEDGFIRLTEDLEIVEYIGLKDIHNHEVYFGDIVRDIEGWIGIIKWNKKECLVFVDYPFNQDSLMIDDAFGSEPEKNIEIVTNIYEDPEFFKGAKQQT